jgi:hypothetical protein
MIVDHDVGILYQKACILQVLPNWFHTEIALFTSGNQHLTKWLPLYRLCSDAPEISYVWLWKPFQPYTQGLPLQDMSYISFVHISTGIPLPTRHPLLPSQTSTLSELKK